jgi:flagellar FliJ protein
MTPASLQSLRTLLEHAEGERDAAQAMLRDAEESARRAEAQAGQLDDYRGQYRERWMAQFRQSASSTLLQCHHGFAQRLDQAIDQQRQQCTQVDQRVARARQQLQAREQRVAAVRKLIERRLQALQQQADRREQKHTDEAAQRAVWQARLAADPH